MLLHKFEHTLQHCKNTKEVDLLLRKGVYPYDYMDNPNKFHETQLPPKEDFYSKLTESHISDEDYQKAQHIWNHFKIKNLARNKLKNSSFIFHAGTKYIGEYIFSNGGRVLNITSGGKTFKKIRKSIILIIKKINWKDGFFRRDIGWRVIQNK